MFITISDFQNNLSHYIEKALQDEVIIALDDHRHVRLAAWERPPSPYEGMPLAEQALANGDFPRQASYEEFLEISGSGDQQYEYIDGVMYLMFSPKTIHQTALGELYTHFAAFFRSKACRPMLAPYDITLRRHARNINIDGLEIRVDTVFQ